jgi:hypothetical protein
MTRRSFSAPAFCAAIGNGLVLGYMMFRSGLVPRRSAQFGMAAGSLALVTAFLVLFGAYDQVSGASGILTLPEAAWELSLGSISSPRASGPTRPSSRASGTTPRPTTSRSPRAGVARRQALKGSASDPSAVPREGDRVPTDRA